MRAGRFALRSLLLLALVLLAAHYWALRHGGPQWLALGKWRHSFAHSDCGIPVHFRLGELDPRFGFDRFSVEAALVEAGNLWQASSEALLFVGSDHPRAMLVSLVFDERQHGANLRRSLRGGLDRDRAELEAGEAMLRQWNEQIEAGRRAYERDSAALAQRVRVHEAALAAWQRGEGERSEAWRRELEAESAGIHTAISELELALDELNGQIAAYNRRAEDMRRYVEDYRGRIATYNTVSSSGPIESGRYSYDRAQGRRISIFRAEGYDELVWILAHELGHALGLGHVEEAGAIMHPLLHEQAHPGGGRARPVELSAADHAALVAVCGPRLRG
jgi:hypothetical protein